MFSGYCQRQTLEVHLSCLNKYVSEDSVLLNGTADDTKLVIKDENSNVLVAKKYVGD